MKGEIRAWLNSRRDYNEGLLLCQEYLSPALVQGITMFKSKDKMVMYLQRLVQEDAAPENVPAPEPIIVSPSIERTITPIVDARQDDETTKRLRNMIGLRLTHIRSLQADNVSTGDTHAIISPEIQERRRQNAMQIVKLDDEWALLNDMLKAYIENNVQPDLSVFEEKKEANDEGFKRIVQLRTNISKTEGKIAKAKEDLTGLTKEKDITRLNNKIQDWEQKLKAWKEEKEVLDGGK